MFTYIEGLPADVLGVRASGAITHEDYQGLNAKVDAMTNKGRLKALYVIDEDVTEHSPHAFWDDQVFTVKHWRDFTHIAIVTDQNWARWMSKIFAPIIPAKVEIFHTAELPAAKAWIINPAGTPAEAAA